MPLVCMFNYVNGITNHSGVELHPISHSKSEHVTLRLVGCPLSLKVGVVGNDRFLLVRKLSWENKCHCKKDFVGRIYDCSKELTFVFFKMWTLYLYQASLWLTHF